MLNFCLLHYLLSSDSEAMTIYKCHQFIVICEISPKFRQNFVWIFLLYKLTYITEMLRKSWLSHLESIKTQYFAKFIL